MKKTKTLPVFRYHPDPVSTGSIVKSDEECECCGKSTGWSLAQQIYCEDDVKTLCPWCVVDGSAAAKFDGAFNDADPLIGAGLDDAIVEEVCKRTPGYESWQGESWMACCNDACEFHGAPARESLLALDQAGLAVLAEETEFPLHELPGILKDYTPGGSPAFYRFVCRHCKAVHHNADCD